MNGFLVTQTDHNKIDDMSTTVLAVHETRVGRWIADVQAR